MSNPIVPDLSVIGFVPLVRQYDDGQIEAYYYQEHELVDGEPLQKATPLIIAFYDDKWDVAVIISKRYQTIYNSCIMPDVASIMLTLYLNDYPDYHLYSRRYKISKFL